MSIADFNRHSPKSGIWKDSRIQSEIWGDLISWLEVLISPSDIHSFFIEWQGISNGAALDHFRLRSLEIPSKSQGQA